MNEFIKKMSLRYACQQFDTSKKVSKEDIQEIIEVFRLTPSLLNIQPWKLFIIEDEDIKKKLQKYSGNQEQVGNNSHLFVFARKNDIDEKFVKKLSQSSQNPEGRKETIDAFLSSMDENEIIQWSFAQASIALGNIISFLAIKGIASCPIGIFEREKYDEILGLTEKGYSSVYNLVIGFPMRKLFIPTKDRLTTSEIVEFL